MGSSGKGKKAPPPPKIEEPIPIVEEADLMAQQEYMDQKADERMSVESTLMTNQVEPKQTMMASASKKKKKKPEDMNTPSMGMY
jgi:hypothetical protein